MLTVVEFKPRKVEHRVYTQEELLAAFKRVENKSDWKKRIWRLVVIKDQEDRQLITQAVIHFTGSVPEFFETATPNKYRVVANGYYAAIGA